MDAVRAPQQRQAPGGVELLGQHQDRHVGPLARGADRGRAGHGVADDGRRADGRGNLGGGGGDRVRRGRLGLRVQGVQQGAVGVVLLGAGDDPVHHGDRLERVVAGRAFGREHDRIRPVVDRRGDVRGLGAGRRRRADHGVEHLGRHHDRLAGQAAGPDDVLLAARHLLGRHLDAEVAARHHDRVRGLDQLREVLERGRLLDLGHQRRAPGDQAPGLGQVLRALDEGQRDPVDPEVEAEAQVGAVLLGERRDRQHDARHVDALVVLQGPAGQHQGLGVVLAAGFDLQAQLAVVQQQQGARFERGEDLGVGQRRAHLVAGQPVEVEAEALPGRQLGLAAGDLADPQLGPLQVEQHADRPVRRRLQLADDGVARLVVVVRAVAEVEPEHVGPGLEQRLDGGGVRGGGAQGRDDLGVAASSHGSKRLQALATRSTANPQFAAFTRSRSYRGPSARRPRRGGRRPARPNWDRRRSMP